MYTIYDILKKFIRKYYENINYHDIYNQHAEIVAALKKKDSDLARGKILEHLDYVESRIRQVVESNNAPGKQKDDPWGLTSVPEIIRNRKITA
jgi:DNA-binding GntR family transcriptional regulator